MTVEDVAMLSIGKSLCDFSESHFIKNFFTHSRFRQSCHAMREYDCKWGREGLENTKMKLRICLGPIMSTSFHCVA